MRLTRQVADGIRRAAKASWPKECCGIVLAGPREPGLGIISLPSPNAERYDPRHRYRLDHHVHLCAVELELREAAVILGYYHSHAAGPAEPSRADAELACPGVTYLVASVAAYEGLRAWIWDGETFREEAVALEESTREGFIDDLVPVREA